MNFSNVAVIKSRVIHFFHVHCVLFCLKKYSTAITLGGLPVAYSGAFYLCLVKGGAVVEWVIG